jgi:hypothetical protein
VDKLLTTVGWIQSFQHENFETEKWM